MFHISTHFIFIFGFVTGIILSIILHSPKNETQTTSKIGNCPYEDWFRNKNFNRKYLTYDMLRYGSESYKLESELLFHSITILCLIMVSKDSNVEAINRTWGKGCTALDYVNIAKKQHSPISLKKNIDNSWINLCEALKKTHDAYEWVLVVNDDIFILMENLRYLLAPLKSSSMFYMGHPAKFWNTIYNMGDAGFVLSKGVLKILKKNPCEINISLRNKDDFMLGNHLSKLNISVTDPKDEQGISLFQPHNLNKLVHPTETINNEEAVNRTCCSRRMISFNAIEGDKMYTYYYLLYTLQIFKSGSLGNHLKQELPEEPFWKKFVEEQNLPLNLSAEEYYQAWENLIDSPFSFAANMKRENYPDDIF